MLQSVPSAFDLRAFGAAAQLPRELVTLSKAGSAERMAFGQQSTRRIGDDFSAESVIASFDERFRGSVRAQAQRFVGDQFVLGEAVMQLGDIKIFGSDAK